MADFIAPLMNKSSAVAEVGDRLAAIDMGRKEGCCAPFGGGERWAPGPHLTQYGLAWTEVYLCTKWHPDPSSRLDKTDMGRKLGEGGCSPLFGGIWFPI